MAVMNSKVERAESSPAVAPATGEVDRGSSPRAALSALLELAFGAKEPVETLISRALLAADRPELPETGPELMVFVRAHLLGPVSDSIGAPLTMVLVDELLERIRVFSGFAQSEPPASLERPVARVLPASSSRRVKRPVGGLMLVD